MVTVEVQYREVVDGAPGPWYALPPVPDGATAETPPLRIGGTFESRARRVDESRGTASGWVPLGEGVITYTNPPPAAVRNLRVVCGESLTWEPAVEGEVSATRFRVLHAPGEWRHYQDMSEAVEGATGLPPFDLCLVPRGRRTLCVVPLDDEGQEGAPAYLSIDRGPFDDAEPVTGRLEEKSPDFLVADDLTLNSMGPAGGTLSATGQVTGDAAPFYVGEDEQVFYNGADADAFYNSSYPTCSVDLRYWSGSTNGTYDPTDDHAVLTFPLTVAAGENWQVFYRPQPAPFYRTEDDTPLDEAPFYHGTDDSKFWHGVDENDPFWGADTDEFYIGEDTDPFYDECPWLPWPGRLASLEPQELDLRLAFPAQVTQAQVTDLAPHESLVPRAGIDFPALGGSGLIDEANLSGGLLPAGERMERGLAVVTATPGPTQVTFAEAFAERPTVMVGIEDAGVDEFAWQFIAGGPSRIGFSVRVYDAAGTEVFTGRIHWLAVGR